MSDRAARGRGNSMNPREDHERIRERRIAEIKEREAKATKGPWVRWEEHAEVFCNNNGLNNPGEMSGNKIFECEPDDLPDDFGDDEDRYIMQAEDNAEFMAHARADIPWLLEQLKTALSERDAAIEECCKAVCIGCENSALWGVVLCKGGYWVHRSINPASELPCKAAAIRSRVAAQEKPE